MKANEFITEKWTKKYKRNIDCSHPKGFSQKAHCAGRKARQAGKKTKSGSINEGEPIVVKLRGPSEKSTEFVKKIYDIYEPSPLSRNNRIMMFGTGNDMQIVQFELVPLPRDEVQIKWIQATPLRSGAGTKAMKILQDLAKDMGVKLSLYAWDNGVVPRSQLNKFYKKVGFQTKGVGDWTYKTQ